MEESNGSTPEILPSLLFDYTCLDPQTSAFVQERTHFIRRSLRRTTEDVIAIGRSLLEVHEKLAPRYKFHAWLRAEFDMTRRTAYRFMAIAKKFGSCDIMSQLSHTVLSQFLDMPDSVIAQVEEGLIPPTIEALRQATCEIQQSAYMGRTQQSNDDVELSHALVSIAAVQMPLKSSSQVVGGFITGERFSYVPLLSQCESTNSVVSEQKDEEAELGVETEYDRSEQAVDTSTLDYYYDDLRREAFQRDNQKLEEVQASTSSSDDDGDFPLLTYAEGDVIEQKALLRDAHVLRVMGSSNSPEWYTPQHIIDRVLHCFGEVGLDPCSNSHSHPAVPARVLYTQSDNGLIQCWRGKTYLNPPYGSEIPAWIAKLIQEYESGNVEEALALLPARIDTNWFEPLYAYIMCNVHGRLQFANSPYHAPFPVVIVYLGQNEAQFIAAFRDLGPIMRRVG